MTVSSLTTNYSFKLIDFNSSPWHDDEHSNWRMLDGILNLITTVPALYGFWENATAYTENQRVVEEETGKVFRCLVDHTSASSGTFSADRTSNPSYWSELTSLPVVRGQWLTATDYAANDVAYDSATSQYLIANTAHTSGVLADDIAASLWTVVFDVSAAVISSIDADSVVYDNASSGLTAIHAQDAIDELSASIDGLSTSLAGKADTSHTHTLSEITDAGSLASKNSVALTDIATISNLRLLGNISGSVATPTQIEVKDEDNMASNSATAIPTQQSVKAYVDNNLPPAGATGITEYVEFTASGTFTKASYTDAKSFEVICQGPGGSGATADYSAGNGGGGGGAGGQAIKVFEPADIAASITVTINSSKAEFTHTTAVVGNAGSNGSGHTGGAGGTATGGDLNFAGASGEDGSDSNNNTSTHGGNGGAPLGLYRLGAGGYRGDTTNVANSPDLDGNNGQGYGGGGGGGSCNSSASGNGSGGSGAAGYVLVKVNY
jgi:hypothetical protein